MNKANDNDDYLGQPEYEFEDLAGEEPEGYVPCYMHGNMIRTHLACDPTCILETDDAYSMIFAFLLIGFGDIDELEYYKPRQDEENTE